MISQINLKPKESGGKGGLFGKIFGGLASIAAAPFTGGASLTALPAISGVGGMIGNAIDPAKMENRKGVSALENYMKVDTDAQVAALDNSRKLIMEDPKMDGPTKEGLVNPISQAIERLTRRA